MKLLVTGATGFIGSHIVEEALRRGYEVWAAVRPTSDTRYLSDSRIHSLELDLSSERQLTEALGDKGFHYVIHAAGVTKALHSATFREVNTLGTQHLVRALQATTPTLRRLVVISSLSVFGPVREALPHTAIRDTDTPQPNTAYGRSKLEAELWLAANCTLPYTILRPTGVYGPREKDYMTMVTGIRHGIDIAAGFTPQHLTFVYVSDVVAAALLALLSEKAVGKAYFISDGETYTSRDFSDAVISQLQRRHTVRLRLPLWLLRIACAVSDVTMRLTGRLSTLNNDHYNILRQRNWLCDISPAMRDLGYQPQVKMSEGVRRIVEKTHPDPPLKGGG